MPWAELLTALALVMILEGLLPFAAPRKYREIVAEVARLGDNNLRTVGLVIIILGLLLLYAVRS